MIDMDSVRAGLADGSLELAMAPPSAEVEEMRAWLDWLLISAAMCLRAAWAFGLIAAWRQWREMMTLAADCAIRREMVLAYMIRRQELTPPVLIVKAATP